MNRGIQIVPGSMASQIQTGGSLAKAFLRVKYVILADCSGSMDAQDYYPKDPRSRWERMSDELRKLQAAHPGEICLISFASDAHLSAGGVPDEVGGGTNMVAGFDFIIAQGLNLPDIQLFVLSDGAPDDQERTLRKADEIKMPIDTIFIGPDADDGEHGREFMRKLARRTKGEAIQDKGALQLQANIERLMLDSGKK